MFTAATRLKLSRALAWSVFFLLLIGASLYFFQQPFLTYPQGTMFQMSAASVQRGGSITLIVPQRCNTSNRKQSYSLARELVRLDAQQTNVGVASSDSVLDPHVCDSVHKAYRIPDDTPSGVYRVEGDAIVPGWFGRTFYIHYTSTPFLVQ